MTLPALPAGKALQRYERFFGTAITLGTHASITFSAVDVLRPFLTSNEGMWQAFEPELRRQLCEMDSAATTAERVHAVLLELLPSNSATIEVAASRLGMSKRTLQRRLEEEGENFRALVSETRRRLACHYLEHTTLSGGDSLSAWLRRSQLLLPRIPGLDRADAGKHSPVISIQLRSAS